MSACLKGIWSKNVPWAVAQPAVALPLCGRQPARTGPPPYDRFVLCFPADYFGGGSALRWGNSVVKPGIGPWPWQRGAGTLRVLVRKT